MVSKSIYRSSVREVLDGRELVRLTSVVRLLLSTASLVMPSNCQDVIPRVTLHAAE